MLGETESLFLTNKPLVGWFYYKVGSKPKVFETQWVERGEGKEKKWKWVGRKLWVDLEQVEGDEWIQSKDIIWNSQ